MIEEFSGVSEKLELEDLSLFKTPALNKFLLKMRKFAHTIQIFTTHRAAVCPSIDILKAGETQINYNDNEQNNASLVAEAE